MAIRIQIKEVNVPVQKNSLGRLLNPRSIAIVGANDKSGYGGRLMRNILSKKYSGEIYPVNPSRKSLMGLTCYPSISAIGKPVDLAVIIVKVELVEDVVLECAGRGVGGVLIITAGYRELDEIGGPERERRLREIARETGMRIVGPNCLGLATPGLDMWACSITTLPSVPVLSGKAALISQSGATGFGPLLSMSVDRGVGLKYLVTTGNETDLVMCDFIQYMVEDDDIESIGVLIEGLQEAKRFAALAKEAQKRGKTIIALRVFHQREQGGDTARHQRRELAKQALLFYLDEAA